MDKEYAIEFKHVSKIYSLKSKDKKYTNDKRFYALKDISFKIPKGEVVGILRHFRVRFCIEKVVVGGDVGDVRGGVEGDLGKHGRGRGEVRGVIARQRGVIRRLYKQGR